MTLFAHTTSRIDNATSLLIILPTKMLRPH